jgi:hypothetical protein
MADLARRAQPRTKRDAAASDAPALFWRHLERLSSTHAPAFSLVVAHLEKGRAKVLRQVNRAMRQAVNRTVTTVGWNDHVPRACRDLALVFPEARGLRISCQGTKSFAEWSPGLLGKIQSVTLSVSAEASSSAVEFLARSAPVRTRPCNPSVACSAAHLC